MNIVSCSNKERTFCLSILLLLVAFNTTNIAIIFYSAKKNINIFMCK